MARPDDLPEPNAAVPTPEQPDANPTAQPAPQTDEVRRNFIRRAGAAIFGVTILGTLGGAVSPETGAPDTGSALCQATPDYAAGEGDQAGCAPPPAYDKDETCGGGNVDEACYTTPSPSPGGARDVDENCGRPTATGTDPDNACGDCDDNHDTDEGCGKQQKDGSYDSDELCGHAHLSGGDADDVCGKAKPDGSTESDQGCGTHKSTYGTFDDPDNNCQTTTYGTPDKDYDNNCSHGTQAKDESCGKNPPPYSGDPDEHCSKAAGDTDEGCGKSGLPNTNPAYDQDGSCGLNGEKDESCGAKVVIPWWPDPADDPDENK